MKVKLDENVTTAASALGADSAIIDACRSGAQMLVTFDVGFGDVRAAVASVAVVIERAARDRAVGVKDQRARTRRRRAEGNGRLRRRTAF